MAIDTNIGNVRPIKIEEEMRASYLDYAHERHRLPRPARHSGRP